MKTRLSSPAWRRPTSTPMVRRTHECNANTCTYGDTQVVCNDCGRKWTMQFAADGKALGYTMQAPLSGLLASAHS